MNMSDLLRLKGAPKPGELAGRSTDPRFYAALSILPNPDPILRRLGQAESVHDAIQSDAHVIGELRTIKAGLERFEHKLVAGGDSRKDKRALELCQSFLDRQPAPHITWTDVIWNVGMAPFRGYTVQEILWERQGDLLMPERLMDRPNRRFAWSPEQDLRLLTRSNLVNGEPTEAWYFLVNRHMPSYDNPYGVALFSSCYWPHVFKHAGFRQFVKFCERFGIPTAVGKYPAGTPEADIQRLEQALENMIEAAYIAMQEGGEVELLETKITGGSQLAQQSLIHECNREMSKALTSQSLATEINQSGARAASEVARGRELDVNEGDREKIAHTLDHLWRLITIANVGQDAKPPRSEFLAEETVSKERAEIYEIFTRTAGGASREAMAAELGIELADPNRPEDAVALKQPAPPAVPGQAEPKPAQFRAFEPVTFADQAAIDAVDVDDRLQPIMQALLKPLVDEVRKGLAPEELLSRLGGLYPQLDDTALEDLMARVIFVADVWGRLSADGQVEGIGDAAA